MDNEAPLMSVGIHAIVTLLGTAFLVLGVVLAYQTVQAGFGWKHVLGTLSAFGIAGDFLAGAFSNRFPFSVLLWLI